MSCPLVLIKQDHHGCFVMARFPPELRDSVMDTAQKLWRERASFKIIEDRSISDLGRQP